MRVITTLDGRDYNNLDIKYSDKNVIYNIQGKESVIESDESVTLSPTNDISNPNILNLSLSDINLVDSAGVKSMSGLFDWKSCYRVEEGYLVGSYHIDVNEIITDRTSISLSYKLYYNQYSSEKTEIANSSNYKSNNLIMTSLVNDKYKDNQNILTTETYIPRAKSSTDYLYISDNVDVLAPKNNNRQDMKITVLSLPNGQTRINVDYKILVYTGQNEFSSFSMLGIGKKTKDIVRFVNKIEFTIKSNVISTKELDFNYSSPYGDGVSGNYELSTNELLQTTLDEEEQNKRSYTLCSKIFDEYKKDKQIITFDLLNIKRYNIGNDKKRFLRCEDYIQIKDELGNYVGEYYNEQGELVAPKYKIIGLEKIWDGSLFFKVTAIQVNK